MPQRRYVREISRVVRVFREVRSDDRVFFWMEYFKITYLHFFCLLYEEWASVLQLWMVVLFFVTWTEKTQMDYDMELIMFTPPDLWDDTPLPFGRRIQLIKPWHRPSYWRKWRKMMGQWDYLLAWGDHIRPKSFPQIIVPSRELQGRVSVQKTKAI
jgi:hypothetical protein